MLKENNAIRQKVNADIWHAKDYTGKGATIVLIDDGGDARAMMEAYYLDVFGIKDGVGHSTNVGFAAHEFGPDVRIMALDSAQKSFDWVKAHKNEIDLINVSQAGIGGSTAPAFEQYEALGIPMICASGNDSYDDRISYPASYQFAIAVGAYDWRQNNIASYSNKGDKLDCVSPSGIYVQRDDKYIWSVYGTSFSAPCACGLLACYIQFRNEKGLPKLTPEQARQFLRSNCLDLLIPGFDKASGYGLFCLPKEIPSIAPVTPDKVKYWRCQTGAFSVKANADNRLHEIAIKGYIGYIVRIEPYFKVQLGAFGVETNCRAFSAKLKSEGVDNFIVYY